MKLRNLEVIAACVLATGLGGLQANAQTPTPIAARDIVLVHGVRADGPSGPEVIPPLQVTDGKHVIELRGTGAQVYTCEASPSGFDWRLRAPEATLQDGAGIEFGRHFTGPSWQARDGSTVVGEVIASDPAPQSDSIPWLLLRAKSHSGSGVFASMGYIARIRTEGGLAPTNGCDATSAGLERRVPYTAVYVFFSE